MNRRQLEHLLALASHITQREDVVVIGSQAILGSFAEEELPAAAILSREADLAFWDDRSNMLSDRVDAAIGELSDFDEMHGYYAQGGEHFDGCAPGGVGTPAHPISDGRRARHRLVSRTS